MDDDQEIRTLEERYCIEGDYTGEDTPLALALQRLSLAASMAAARRRYLIDYTTPPTWHEQLVNDLKQEAERSSGPVRATLLYCAGKIEERTKVNQP
jgi:hypothetical protein